jgi:spore germination protein YaaH
MAYDFGIITGLTPTAFGPSDYALREQAAAMMIRLHERHDSKLGWSHAFYAVRAYPQKDLISDFDAVSFSWSRLELTDGIVRLNTTASGGNSHAVPDGSEEVLRLAAGAGAARQLSVYMSALEKVTLADGTETNPCAAILTDDTMRAEAAAQIAAQLQGGQYTGVTVDFEEMRGETLKNGFNLFLGALRLKLDELGASLYVCVHPVTTDGIYYDAYDYKAIGELADKVILMAHDYAANTLTQAEMDAGFTATPVSPFYEIYAALKAATDPVTGVSDRSKLALAVSLGVIQWKLQDGRVMNASAYKPDLDAVFSRMTDPATVINYSDKYQNPYITYHDDTDNTDSVAWYEDTRSVDAKMELARMFGVTGLSVWRLGMIPDYPDPEGCALYYDFPAWLEAQT